MSISRSVGALSQYLSEIKLSNAWKQSRSAYDRTVERVPVVGPTALELSRRFRKSIVSFAQPGQLFEDLGITYVGVVPGHDLRALVHTFRSALALGGPVLVHVRTQKGRGYHPAEKDQVGFHGAALPPMTDTYQARRARPASPLGAGEISATVAPGAEATENGNGKLPPDASPGPRTPNYTHFFAQEVIAAAREDRRIVAITAGMPTGTGLNRFQAEFPDRFVDVGIAEQHAVALATGIALGGGRPVVAIYATFMQRAFDQIVHDVCQNDQPVLLGLDRAGLVGEDGTSHQGMFSFPAHRQVPNLVIAAPKDEQELRSMVRTGLAQDHPFALSYPRDAGFGVPERDPQVLPVGRGEVLREGSDILLVGLGPIVRRAEEAANALAAEGWSVGVINARFLKPLDRQLILDQARGKKLVVTLEESTATAGFGSAVLEALEEARLADPTFRDVCLRIVGIPGDRFVDHGSVADLRALVRLDTAGIVEQVRETLATLRVAPGRAARRPSGAASG
jgi:1-deoxy-D-xylulose-5-phosphate synthase